MLVMISSSRIWLVAAPVSVRVLVPSLEEIGGDPLLSGGLGKHTNKGVMHGSEDRDRVLDTRRGKCSITVTAVWEENAGELRLAGVIGLLGALQFVLAFLGHGAFNTARSTGSRSARESGAPTGIVSAAR